MIDVHVLMSERIPKDWVEGCLRSIDVAASRAPFSIILNEYPEVIGDTWAARKVAYLNGKSPYVCRVDLDDWLSPDAFASLTQALNDNALGVQTRGIGYDLSKQNKATNRAEGLLVFQRILLEEIDWSNSANECCTEHAMLNILKNRIRYVEERGLHRRLGYNSLGAQRRQGIRHGLG